VLGGWVFGIRHRHGGIKDSFLFPEHLRENILTRSAIRNPWQWVRGAGLYLGAKCLLRQPPFHQTADVPNSSHLPCRRKSSDRQPAGAREQGSIFELDRQFPSDYAIKRSELPERSGSFFFDWRAEAMMIEAPPIVFYFLETEPGHVKDL